MRGERVAGATLYALALILLLAGVGWFVRAAPRVGEDPVVAAGRVTAERLLPDLPEEGEAETVVLAEGVHKERDMTKPGGSYTLRMLCVGSGQVRVRLSSTGEDSGRAVACAAQEPQPVELTVAVADDLHLAVSAESRGAVVFRWLVMRTRDY